MYLTIAKDLRIRNKLVISGVPVEPVEGIPILSLKEQSLSEIKSSRIYWLIPTFSRYKMLELSPSTLISWPRSRFMVKFCAEICVKKFRSRSLASCMNQTKKPTDFQTIQKSRTYKKYCCRKILCFKMLQFKRIHIFDIERKHQHIRGT